MTLMHAQSCRRSPGRSVFHHGPGECGNIHLCLLSSRLGRVAALSMSLHLQVIMLPTFKTSAHHYCSPSDLLTPALSQSSLRVKFFIAITLCLPSTAFSRSSSWTIFTIFCSLVCSRRVSYSQQTFSRLACPLTTISRLQTLHSGCSPGPLTSASQRPSACITVRPNRFCFFPQPEIWEGLIETLLCFLQRAKTPDGITWSSCPSSLPNS